MHFREEYLSLTWIGHGHIDIGQYTKIEQFLPTIVRFPCVFHLYASQPLQKCVRFLPFSVSLRCLCNVDMDSKFHHSDRISSPDCMCRWLGITGIRQLPSCQSQQIRKCSQYSSNLRGAPQSCFEPEIQSSGAYGGNIRTLARYHQRKFVKLPKIINKLRYYRS